MKMKKILSAILCIAMMMSVMSFAAFAEGEAVAKIGAEEFATLQEAIDAATEGDTVTLVSDIALEEGVVVAADDVLTLDLNGYVVSYDSAVAAGNSALKNMGNLTIDDLSDDKTGKITYNSTAVSASNAYATNAVVNGGVLTIENGTIENTTASGASYAVDTAWYSDNSQEPTLIVNGGTISAVKPAVRMIGYSAAVSNNLELNGGEIIGQRGLWIHLPSNKNDVAPLINVDINGGKLTATGETGDYKLAIYSYSFGDAYNGVDIAVADGEITGDIAIGAGSANGGTGAEKLVVTGGTFDGEVYTYNSKTEDNISISGGTYTVAVDSAYIADGYALTDNGDNTFTVNEMQAVAAVGEAKYATLQEAIDAANPGETVTLLADITVDETKTSGYTFLVGPEDDITLDLNGFNISGTVNATANYSVISVQGKLTVVGEGLIELTNTDNSTSYAFYSAVIALNNHDGYTVDTALTLGEGVTVRHNGGTVMAYGVDMLTYTGCEVTVDGATIESAYIGIRAFGNHGNKALTVNSGSIFGNTVGYWVHGDGTADIDATINGGVISSDKAGLQITTTANSKNIVDVVINGGSLEGATPLKLAVKHAEDAATVTVKKAKTLDVTAPEGYGWTAGGVLRPVDTSLADVAFIRAESVSVNGTEITVNVPYTAVSAGVALVPASETATVKYTFISSNGDGSRVSEGKTANYSTLNGVAVDTQLFKVVLRDNGSVQVMEAVVTDADSTTTYTITFNYEQIPGYEGDVTIDKGVRTVSEVYTADGIALTANDTETSAGVILSAPGVTGISLSGANGVFFSVNRETGAVTIVAKRSMGAQQNFTLVLEQETATKEIPVSISFTGDSYDSIFAASHSYAARVSSDFITVEGDEITIQSTNDKAGIAIYGESLSKVNLLNASSTVWTGLINGNKSYVVKKANGATQTMNLLAEGKNGEKMVYRVTVKFI